ncbi:hypothetical protein [Nonomuraea dietziae]|uniref:hypothetical protein n=1 Tax=Nonomuraea dietziae TaxID=65515 RepID=UPI0031E076EC
MAALWPCRLPAGPPARSSCPTLSRSIACSEARLAFRLPYPIKAVGDVPRTPRSAAFGRHLCPEALAGLRVARAPPRAVSAAPSRSLASIDHGRARRRSGPSGPAAVREAIASSHRSSAASTAPIQRMTGPLTSRR